MLTEADLDRQRTVVRAPAGIPPYRLHYTYRAILALQDAGPLLAQWRINCATYNPTTAAAGTQQQLVEESVQSA